LRVELKARGQQASLSLSGRSFRRSGPLRHCLFHAVNHGTLHRGEAAALLAGYGQSPGDFDFTLFLSEHQGPPS
jgi:uncharacterized damage-inducible protein DinB